ncbi:MAG: trypsin-like serine protease [Deltaproteobacteria bacterium]|nr:trypsin-like serine protease [Deltaproteobacteria bacterium]
MQTVITSSSRILLGLLVTSSLAIAAPAGAQGWSPYIIGGVPAPEMESVGAFIHGDGWFCTGTVVAPRVVLTAAHCLSDLRGPEDASFFLGPDSNDLGDGRVIPLAELHVHPDYAQTDNADIAVAILAEDAGVEPIAVNLEPLGQDLVGEVLTFVGYGYSIQDVEGGDKRKVDIAVSGVSEFFIDYETAGKNTCQGDSGGPALLWDNGGVAWLLGVTSYGDAECAVDGHNTRADVFAPFVSAFLDGDWQGDPAVGQGGQVPIEPGTDPDDGVDDVDFCDFLGWYEDGVCDDCPSPDPDCEGEDPDDFQDDDEDDDYDDEGCAGGPIDVGALLGLWLVTRRRRTDR